MNDMRHLDLTQPPASLDMTPACRLARAAHGLVLPPRPARPFRVLEEAIWTARMNIDSDSRGATDAMWLLDKLREAALILNDVADGIDAAHGAENETGSADLLRGLRDCAANVARNVGSKVEAGA